MNSESTNSGPYLLVYLQNLVTLKWEWCPIIFPGPALILREGILRAYITEGHFRILPTDISTQPGKSGIQNIYSTTLNVLGQMKRKRTVLD